MGAENCNYFHFLFLFAVKRQLKTWIFIAPLQTFQFHHRQMDLLLLLN